MAGAEGNLPVALPALVGRRREVEALSAVLGRATHVKDDMAPDFVFDGQAYVAEADLAPGNWNIRMTARAEDGTEFAQRVILHIRG